MLTVPRQAIVSDEVPAVGVECVVSPLSTVMQEELLAVVRLFKGAIARFSVYGPEAK